MLLVKDVSKELDNWIKEYIKDSKNYFLTGSFQFGTSHQDSDIDVCFPISFVDMFRQVLNSINIPFEESHYNAGIKFYYDKRKINFVFLHPVEYVCWYKTAKMIKSCNLFQSYSDIRIERQKAHAIHQLLLASVKLTLPVINNVNMLNFITDELSVQNIKKTIENLVENNESELF